MHIKKISILNTFFLLENKSIILPSQSDMLFLFLNSKYFLKNYLKNTTFFYPNCNESLSEHYFALLSLYECHKKVFFKRFSKLHVGNFLHFLQLQYDFRLLLGRNLIHLTKNISEKILANVGFRCPKSPP